MFKEKSKNCQTIVDKNTDSLVSYLKKSYPKKTPLFVHNLSKKFHTEFLSNFLSNFQKLNSDTEITFLKKILLEIKNKKLVVSEADKNIGIVLIESKIYNTLSLEHLNDDKFYKKIESDPTTILLDKCQNLIKSLFSQHHLSKDIFNLFEKNILNKNIAKFRLLPKLHKTKFGIRPIINCKNSILEIFSKSLDFFMKVIASEQFSFLKDSQNLIQKTISIFFSKNSKLFTADFEALYSNIPLEEAIIILSDIMAKVKSSYFTAYGFHCIIKLVLENNFFFFKNKTEKTFYLQIKGIAMGTTCGPSVANLYLGYFESRYLALLNTSLYFRFIDDLFLLQTMM